MYVSRTFSAPFIFTQLFPSSIYDCIMSVPTSGKPDNPNTLRYPLMNPSICHSSSPLKHLRIQTSHRSLPLSNNLNGPSSTRLRINARPHQLRTYSFCSDRRPILANVLILM
ncbi:hypothetical protein QCA50_016399 [Cerrena zonata]|uniref:Uncharacterized protein n=1 Tax=Cerrena zonata TaxID=2478898 RepID=A0AAW0FKB3_9APHY